MNYIISPWIVYLGRVFNGLQEVSYVVLTISTVVFVIAFGVYVAAHIDDCKISEEDEKSYKRALSRIAKVIIVFLLITIFVPDRETCFGMVASSYITTDNVTAATDYGKKVVDYIFEKMQEEKND